MHSISKIKKGIIYSLTLVSISALMLGCDTYVFGVKKEIWETLNDSQKNQVIENYNKREAEQQKLDAALKEKELENEKTLAPYKTISKVVEQIVNTKEASKKNESQTLTFIDTTFNKIRTSNKSKYSVSFGDSSKIKKWKVGEHVIATQNSSYEFYKINIVNLDRNESINANKES